MYGNNFKKYCYQALAAQISLSHPLVINNAMRRPTLILKIGKSEIYLVCPHLAEK